MKKYTLTKHRSTKMHLRKLFYLMLILPVLFLNTACSDDDNGGGTTEPEPQTNESQILAEYLEANGDFANTQSPAMVSASDVHTDVITDQEYHIIDIRAESDYKAGHIEGAVNVKMADLLDHFENEITPSEYEKVVLVCYSGQSAGFATSVMRMLGYDNVYDMKFGMSSWNQDCANSWEPNISNKYATQFVQDSSPKAEAGELPELNTGLEDGAAILRARAETLLTSEWPKCGISADNVYADLEGHYIVNYWPQAHYDWGHIEGAIQYTPGESLRLENALKTLPTDKPVVVYCYTGQNSAHIGAFLRMLGYDAKSLLFGVNGMAYNDMPGTKFDPDTHIMGYDYVTED